MTTAVKLGIALLVGAGAAGGAAEGLSRSANAGSSSSRLHPILVDHQLQTGGQVDAKQIGAVVKREIERANKSEDDLASRVDDFRGAVEGYGEAARAGLRDVDEAMQR